MLYMQFLANRCLVKEIICRQESEHYNIHDIACGRLDQIVLDVAFVIFCTKSDYQ